MLPRERVSVRLGLRLRWQLGLRFDALAGIPAGRRSSSLSMLAGEKIGSAVVGDEAKLSDLHDELEHASAKSSARPRGGIGVRGRSGSGVEKDQARGSGACEEPSLGGNEVGMSRECMRNTRGGSKASRAPRPLATCSSYTGLTMRRVSPRGRDVSGPAPAKRFFQQRRNGAGGVHAQARGARSDQLYATVCRGSSAAGVEGPRQGHSHA